MDSHLAAVLAHQIADALIDMAPSGLGSDDDLVLAGFTRFAIKQCGPAARRIVETRVKALCDELPRHVAPPLASSSLAQRPSLQRLVMVDPALEGLQINEARRRESRAGR